MSDGTHVGFRYAAVPVEERIVHDPHCCSSRGCHRVCSHLCGTDLAAKCCYPDGWCSCGQPNTEWHDCGDTTAEQSVEATLRIREMERADRAIQVVVRATSIIARATADYESLNKSGVWERHGVSAERIDAFMVEMRTFLNDVLRHPFGEEAPK